jgi:hypothetical protein
MAVSLHIGGEYRSERSMEAPPETKMQYFTVQRLKPNNEKPQRDELLRELVKGLQRSLKRQTFVCTCNQTAPLPIPPCSYCRVLRSWHRSWHRTG